MVQVMEIALVIKSRVFAMVYKARCYSHLHCFLPLILLSHAGALAVPGKFHACSDLALLLLFSCVEASPQEITLTCFHTVSAQISVKRSFLTYKRANSTLLQNYHPFHGFNFLDATYTI